MNKNLGFLKVVPRVNIFSEADWSNVSLKNLNLIQEMMEHSV